MTQEQLIQFLKDNLRIELEVQGCWEDNEIGVYLYLGDKIISSDFASI